MFRDMCKCGGAMSKRVLSRTQMTCTLSHAKLMWRRDRLPSHSAPTQEELEMTTARAGSLPPQCLSVLSPRRDPTDGHAYDNSDTPKASGTNFATKLIAAARPAIGGGGTPPQP